MQEKPSTSTNAAADPALARDLEVVLRKANYHKFVLPGGQETAGTDRTATAQAIFSFAMQGKSLLDIGCHHGYYCIEAKKRGAALVAGIEGDHSNYKLACRIRNIFGFESYELVEGYYPKVKLSTRAFDAVLLLNVVHHLETVKKADAMIVRAAGLARERLILGIRPPHSEPGSDVEIDKNVLTMETIATRLNKKTGKTAIIKKALLGREHIRELLAPHMSRVDIFDSPDYPGRFIAVGIK